MRTIIWFIYFWAYLLWANGKLRRGLRDWQPATIRRWTNSPPAGCPTGRAACCAWPG